MKKITKVLLFILGIVFFFACKKEEIIQAELDKEVRVPFPVNDGTFNISFETFAPSTYLKDFDKRDYPGVDSITFICSLLSGNLSDTAYVRLYNVTDSSIIDNTLLAAATPLSTYVVVQTNNIFNMLPDKKIDLAIQAKSSDKNNYIIVASAFLKLRRN